MEQKKIKTNNVKNKTPTQEFEPWTLRIILSVAFAGLSHSFVIEGVQNIYIHTNLGNSP